MMLFRMMERMETQRDAPRAELEDLCSSTFVSGGKPVLDDHRFAEKVSVFLHV
jgi:hypothetical protein